MAAAGAGRCRRDDLDHRPGPLAQPLALRGEPLAVAVAAELEGDRGLGAGHRARELGELSRAVAGHRTGREDPGRRLFREVGPARVVPARLGAGLEQKGGRRHGSARDGDQIAVDPALGAGDPATGGVEFGDHRAAHLAAADGAHNGGAPQQGDPRALDPLGEVLIGPAGTGVGDRRHLDPRLGQRQRRLEAAVGRRRHHRPAARRDAVQRGQSLRARAQHHPRQVVALEHQRLLDRSRGGDVASGAHLVQGALPPHRDDPVEVAECRRGGEHLDPGGAHALAELARPLRVGAGQQRPAELRPVVGEHDVGAELGRPERRGHPREAAADHEHVGVPAPVVRPPATLGLATHEPPEPGRVAQDLLVQGPQPPRADEGLVVEARRRQPLAEDVGGPHDVEVERRRGVHVRDGDPLAHGLGAGADAGRPVDVDEAVRALAGAAEEPAGTVVLEAAREHLAPAGGERGPDRVALERFHRLAVEAEAHGPIAVDQLARGGGKASHRSGRPTHWTSLVRVSRSARNHARQPERWFHHSRWTPATLRRK